MKKKTLTQSISEVANINTQYSSSLYENYDYIYITTYPNLASKKLIK